MTTQNLIMQREDKQIFRDGDLLIKRFDANYSKADILNEAKSARLKSSTASGR